MTATKMNRWLGLALAGLVLAAAGCDPYEEGSDAAPAVVRVAMADQSFSGGGVAPVYIEAPDPVDGVWRIPSQIDPISNAVLVVTTNKLLDGASISTAPDNCEPVAANFDFSGAPLLDPLTYAWWACYYPSSASESWGSSIVIFQSLASTIGTDGAYAAELDFGTQYNIVVSVLDVQGKPLGFEVEFTTIP